MSKFDRVITILLSVAALPIAGCVAETPTDDCAGCRLEFSFTRHSDGNERLMDDVHDIGLYVFDSATGVLVDVVGVEMDNIAHGGRMEYADVGSLPNGRYTFVAWGGSGNDIFRSFSARHMLDASSHDHAAIEVGRTTLDDFYMMLDYESVEDDLITPATADFDDLFFAVRQNIEIVRGKNHEVGFDFIRNTNVLKITVTGIEHLLTATRAADSAVSVPTAETRADEGVPLDIFAIGRNGRHRWDNTIDPHARRVMYSPQTNTLTNSTLVMEVKTMRLDMERHLDDPVLLHIQDPATGRPVTQPIDVMRAILQTRSTRTGEFLYPDQEAIDRGYEYPIDIHLGTDEDGGLTIRLYVEGWEIIILKPDTNNT